MLDRTPHHASPPGPTVAPAKVVVSGWTGHHAAAAKPHIEELKALGVSARSGAPILYLGSLSRVACADAIEAPGGDTSDINVLPIAS